MIIERRRKRRLGRFFTLVLVGGIFLYFGINFFLRNNSKKELISPIAEGSALVFFTPVPSVVVKDGLAGAVQLALVGTKGIYGVAIKNLKNGQNYYFNEHQVFEAGSLYKLWVMAETFNQIQNGDLSEDEVLSGKIADLNKAFNISEDVAELTEGGITQSVTTALTQMITISHNYAAMLLTKKVKLSNVKLFLQKNGFIESKLGDGKNNPTTTAFDIALFIEKLYKGELANPDNTIKMIELLKGQKLNDKLPKNLPEDVVVAHKTGEIDYFSHDAGIVYASSGDYIIVVLSKSDTPAGAEERISQISKEVYEYFQK